MPTIAPSGQHTCTSSQQYPLPPQRVRNRFRQYRLTVSRILLVERVVDGMETTRAFTPSAVSFS